MGASLVLKEIMTVLVILEESGSRYYRELAESQGDLQIRTLFVMLANDEIRHRKTYGELCYRLGLNAELLARDPLAAAQIDAEFGLGEHQGPFRSMEEAVDASMELEQKTLRYLSDLEAHLPEAEKQRLKQLVDEERRHIALLSDLKGRLKK